MKRIQLAIVFSVILVSINISPFGAVVSPLAAQDEIPTDLPVIVEAVPGMQGQDVGTLDYTFPTLSFETLLRSDGSAVHYIGNLIRNNSSEPMDSHTWCFYWGQDVYSSIFAKDEQHRYLVVDYYEDYSDVFGRWGLCVESSFDHAIQDGGEYWYALGITIDNHHTVENDVMHAASRISSSSIIQDFTEKVSWPYNHRGVTADPPPDILTKSYAQWSRTSAEVPWEFTVDIYVTLGDQMAVDPLSQGTSPFDGKDIAWEKEPYGVNTGKTIGDWGCTLTSYAMAMNYYAKVLGFHDQLDPDNLNTWLVKPISEGSIRPQGYGPNGDPGVYSFVDPDIMDDASKDLFDATHALIVPGAVEDVKTIPAMRDNLQNGQLGVLGVDNGGISHYVLVTGYTTQNGQETVTINDPYESRGSTTLLAQYNNQHGSIRWSSPADQTARPNYVTLYANCPVSLLVTDQYGHRTGYDPRTGQSYEEIPSSVYVTEYSPGVLMATSEGTKILQMESYERSEYWVDVIGTGTGSYTIDYRADIASGETDRGTYGGTTAQDQVDTLHLVYDPNAGFWRYVFLPLLMK